MPLVEDKNRIIEKCDKCSRHDMPFVCTKCKTKVCWDCFEKYEEKCPNCGEPFI